MQSSSGKWFWLGMGVVGVALTSALVFRHYRVENKRHIESDPRATQVRALIAEAEKLILLGRRGTVEPL